ncbi:hypothetical protein MJA45_17160 [Paenibacillus aurantius]|uniref:Cytochrome C oxidase subunit II n=1 Tax=Paenibacillus aurantius TaxID=2918900 RepID=A0AA96RDF5_9BACL|nr:hypothetical protein [Paenibacillus aurantius]WJH34260.1 hypothetical protein N6H14_30940 [Paenibacillus sp. CC-CFT747]WNQ09356.1 hypothetical protein MJA45_17160 [Paenibacillus aurantius]
MYKWIMFVLFVGAGVLGLGTLFGEVAQHARENAPDTSGVPKLALNVSNFKFDQPEYTVKAGEKVKVSMNIKEGIHEVGIKDFNVHLTKDAPTAEVTFDKPGTYVVECVLPCGPGHDGMKTKLVVQ